MDDSIYDIYFCEPPRDADLSLHTNQLFLVLGRFIPVIGSYYQQKKLQITTISMSHLPPLIQIDNKEIPRENILYFEGIQKLKYPFLSIRGPIFFHKKWPFICGRKGRFYINKVYIYGFEFTLVNGEKLEKWIPENHYSSVTEADRWITGFKRSYYYSKPQKF